MRPIPILAMVTTFRERLAATIRTARPILEEPGVLVSGLLLEKLVTERTGEKGDRDLLVALALLSVGRPDDLDTFDEQYRRLRPDLRHAIRSNLTILSLLQPRPGMPDPTDRRADVAALLRRLEAGEVDA